MPISLIVISLKHLIDRVNHNILDVKKLIHRGVRRCIIPIVCSFLNGRTQNTKLKNHTCISSGVPQGTKLGPILFLVLVNDAAIGSYRRWKYVEDLTLVNPGEQSQLQTNLDDHLSNWCKNDILPNASKCQIMKIIFLRRQTPNYNFSLNSSGLKSLTQMKLLYKIIEIIVIFLLRAGKTNLKCSSACMSYHTSTCTSGMSTLLYSTYNVGSSLSRK